MINQLVHIWKFIGRVHFEVTRNADRPGKFASCDIASMAGYVVIRITERLGGGESFRTAYAVAEPNQHRAIALFKLRPDHTAGRISWSASSVLPMRGRRHDHRQLEIKLKGNGLMRLRRPGQGQR